MMEELDILLIYTTVLLAVCGIGEMIHRWGKVRAEITRKLVHIAGALVCLTFPIYISSLWSIVSLLIGFSTFLYLSIKFDFLRSISAVKRRTIGARVFPLSIFIVYLAYHFRVELFGVEASSPVLFYYFVPVGIFAISDPLAALVGQKWPRGRYKLFYEAKTLSGSLAFLISAAAICYFFLYDQPSQKIDVFTDSIVIALATTVAEGVAERGLDNIFIPIAAICTMYFVI